MQIDLSTIIVTILTGIVTLIGVRAARAGQKEGAVQQAAANKLERDQLQLESFKVLIPQLETEIDRASRARNEAREEAEVERLRRVEIERVLRAELDIERTRRVEAETALRLSEDAAKRALKRSGEDYGALLLLVRDEVAREAGRTEVVMEQGDA